MDKSNQIILPFILGLIVNIFSFYLFQFKFITLTGMLIILICFILFMIITSFQGRLRDYFIRLEILENKIHQLDERLKIHRELIDIKSDIKYLKEKNGKT